MNKNKGSISKLLMTQAKESLLSSIDARDELKIDVEVRLSINVHLLLGISLEGIINEIGEEIMDKWTWEELEKGSTPLKWGIVSGLKKGFVPSEEPLQTIQKIQKIRNKIAHPKLENQGDEGIAISQKKDISILTKDDDKLPEGDFNLYYGYKKLIYEYNAREALCNMIKVIEAINKIKKLHRSIEKKFQWSDELYEELKDIKIEKNECDK